MKGARPWRQSLRVKGLPKMLKLCAESGLFFIFFLFFLESGLSAGPVLIDWLPSVKFQGRDSTGSEGFFQGS